MGRCNLLPLSPAEPHLGHRRQEYPLTLAYTVLSLKGGPHGRYLAGRVSSGVESSFPWPYPDPTPRLCLFFLDIPHKAQSSTPPHPSAMTPSSRSENLNSKNRPSFKIVSLTELGAMLAVIKAQQFSAPLVGAQPHPDVRKALRI